MARADRPAAGPSELSGSVIVRYQASRNRSMNQAQTCTGGPKVEANWHEAACSAAAKRPWRHRPRHHPRGARPHRWLKGMMGAWSDSAKIMVV